MAHIQVLDKETIDKIAAGEVVERPSSVVKELVENAMDAGATAVTVEIKDGGTSLIRITDNGCGIAKEDIPVAFLRHSTSKIRSVEDLFNVSSLGFRGEALSSIAAVSKVELITKSAGAMTGTRYRIEGGSEVGMEAIGCPTGTTFIVKNLFYNTPARQKFLKTAQTEGSYIGDLIERMALSHPNVSFNYISNNQNKLHTSGNANLKDIIYNVYGREITSNLLSVHGENGELALDGFIGKPTLSRGNRGFENYYINGRYIKSRMITKAIEDAYKTYVMVHKYPFTVIHLAVPSKFIDVNVHPTKMEVRFNNGEDVYRFIYESVKGALSKRELIPKADIAKDTEETPAARAEMVHVPEPFEVSRLAALGKNRFIKEGAANYQKPEKTKKLVIAQPEIPIESADQKTKVPENPKMVQRPPVKETETEANPQQLELFDDRLLSAKARINHRIIGQVFETYWLVEYDQKLYIVDQHAAHEKVLYEKIRENIKNKTIASQYLNPPVILSLSLKEMDILNKYEAYFVQAGFEIEAFGGKEYALRAVPQDLFGMSEKEMFLDMLDSFESSAIVPKSDTVMDRIATMACKAAVKGNQRLSFEEMDALMDQLLKAENPYNCPHGRPTIISMSRYELEKKFKRIQ